MLGSWEVNVTINSMPEKVASAVSALSEQLIGCEYKPIAYLGSQAVNGINHAVLAEQTVLTGKDTKNVVVLIFNEKPNDMKATLVNIERVVEQGGEMGGIVVDVKTDIPADAKEAFDKAFDGFVGSNVEPFALLATQVVNGTNYIFAAEVTSVTAEPVKTVSIVTVNNIAGTVEFDNIFDKKDTKLKALGYAFTWLKNQANASRANSVSGGWNIGIITDGMPQKVATAFGKLCDLIGARYTPIAYVGSQIVNGTNHAVLAEQEIANREATKNIVLIVFNEPIDASADDLTVVSIKNVVEGGSGFGAVDVNVEIGDKINKTAQRVFDQHFGGFCGSVVTPVALLATQVVRGTEYYFFCECTPVLSDNDVNNKKAVIVTVNDISEGVQITDLFKPEINRSLGAPLGEWP